MRGCHAGTVGAPRTAEAHTASSVASPAASPSRFGGAGDISGAGAGSSTAGAHRTRPCLALPSCARCVPQMLRPSPTQAPAAQSSPSAWLNCQIVIHGLFHSPLPTQIVGTLTHAPPQPREPMRSCLL